MRKNSVRTSIWSKILAELRPTRVSVKYVEMFVSMFQLELHAGQDVVVYDQNSSDPNHLSPESFLNIVLLKLERMFTTVHLLSGQSKSKADPHQSRFSQRTSPRSDYQPSLAAVLTLCLIS